MASPGVDVQLGRYAVLPELGVIERGEERPVAIVVGDGDKGRRRRRTHLDERVELLGVGLGVAEIGWVDQRHEARSRIELVDGIDRLVALLDVKG